MCFLPVQSYMTDEGTTLGAQFSPPGSNVAAYILTNYLPQFIITPTAVPWVVLASAVSLTSDVSWEAVLE